MGEPSAVRIAGGGGCELSDREHRRRPANTGQNCCADSCEGFYASPSSVIEFCTSGIDY